MKIAIIGAGYVGLVSAACLAEFGHQVICVDVDAARVAGLQRGEMPIFEPGLGELVSANVAAGRLGFSTALSAAVPQADMVFLAVGTPPRAEDGHADLRYVHAAARGLASHLSGFTVVVTKSTVPVGTGDAVAAIIAEVNPAADFAVVSNPEFLREGAAIGDFQRPDRIIVGLEDERARAPMEALYAPLEGVAPLVFCGRRSAELTKYAANAFLAMKITFINEIADLCEAMGGDVQQVALGIGLDERIGKRFLNAGPGFGGSCFPKDTMELVQAARAIGAPLRLVETTIESNEERRRAMARKIAAACGGSVDGKTIAVLGLTFKPGTDDMRGAPSIAILEALLAAGARVRAYDPEGMAVAQPILPGVEMGSGPYDVADGADAVVLMTEWEAFTALDLVRLRTVMRGDAFVDLRNVYSQAALTAAGFRAFGIGRANNTAL